MASLFALLIGLVFGMGLLVSGMVNPAKVLAFLDITGAWDLSLALVMLGAVTVGSLVHPCAKRMPQSFTGSRVLLPTATRLD